MTDALIYMLQAIYEAADGGEASARIFFADFFKGFDLIDHSILLQELADLEVHPVLLSWIAAFLTSRMQAVRIGRTLSDWLTLGSLSKSLRQPLLRRPEVKKPRNDAVRMLGNDLLP